MRTIKHSIAKRKIKNKNSNKCGQKIKKAFIKVNTSFMLQNTIGKSINFVVLIILNTESQVYRYAAGKRLEYTEE